MRLNLLIQFQVVFTFKKCVYISSSQMPLLLCPELSFMYYSLFLFTDISMGFGSRKEMYACALSAILNKSSYCIFGHLCDFFLILLPYFQAKDSLKLPLRASHRTTQARLNFYLTALKIFETSFISSYPL